MAFPLSTSALRVVALASLLVLSACGDEERRDEREDTGQAGTGLPPELPSPEGAIGSVTGMPAQPGPGTSPIEPVRPGTTTDPASTAWMGDAYVEGMESAEYTAGMETEAPLSGSLQPPPLPAPPPPEAMLADAPPIILVPDLPPPDVPPVEPARPPDVPPPRTTPIGTEGATESTTIVVEPDPDD